MRDENHTHVFTIKASACPIFVQIGGVFDAHIVGQLRQNSIKLINVLNVKIEHSKNILYNLFSVSLIPHVESVCE